MHAFLYVCIYLLCIYVSMYLSVCLSIYSNIPEEVFLLGEVYERNHNTDSVFELVYNDDSSYDDLRQ